ncbi:hypothetical protein SBS99_17755 [Klebsiella pneumoniae]|uniref:hypothetical protein n=1 Tax=Klebsiella pneumoniae TaxID=573 RepID=UPI00298C0876|nr:hypothetical protein [Klebsiella pneumoniae]MDW5802418.1 hypothetical protein [Klebsiella pneumoniae]MDW5885628.1 hypothetical protein [Klebsiella pneumoniae]
MGSCAAPSAKGDDKFITTDYLQQCPLKAQAADDSQTDPTMEQAFITLINRWDKENSHGQ